MTNATSSALEKFYSSQTFAHLTTTVSVVAVALLIALIIERELLRASMPASSDRQRDLSTFAVVLIPMAVVFVSVIIARFIRLS